MNVPQFLRNGNGNGRALDTSDLDADLGRLAAEWRTVQAADALDPRIDELIRAVLEAAEAAAWQPIETAPDSKLVLTVWDGKNVTQENVSHWEIAYKEGEK
jgi:hypothetical protein